MRIKKGGYMPDAKVVLKTQVESVDIAKKVAYGWAYVSSCNDEIVVDHSGQVWPIEEVVKTAQHFVCDCRVGGEMHITKGGATLVESIVFTKDIQKALGIDLKKEGWFVGFRIDDEVLLEKIKKGDLGMLSIGGVGLEQEIV